MLTLSYDPVFGHKYYQYVPHSKYYLEYNIRGPVDFYEPKRYTDWFPYYWPSHLMARNPTDYSVRNLRLRNHLYSLRSST
ncbi:hypothetical protein GWI33_001172 [Rhynchophorus ferrugineus]|uniref:Uncharacterized protein n=1 Tax=Rhynchophorus ferrugineus TaxID=354439 RepID=A0A834ILZ0_RHYFE|nr:hypothetical protein GWI33_001172 [Rhynchophorus ferrugineus]